MSKEKLNEAREDSADMLGVSRRAFLATTGAVGVVAAIDARGLMAQNPALSLRR